MLLRIRARKVTIVSIIRIQAFWWKKWEAAAENETMKDKMSQVLPEYKPIVEMARRGAEPIRRKEVGKLVRDTDSAHANGWCGI